LVDAVLTDYTSAPIDEKDKALLRLIDKTNSDSRSVRHEDLDCARAAGWSDEALYDALSVCAIFQFFNTWVDATGVHDLPAAMYAMAGKRLAGRGYDPTSRD